MVVALDGVDCVDKPAEVFGVLKIAAQVGPVFMPGTDDHRVLLVSFCGEVFKVPFRLFREGTPGTRASGRQGTPSGSCL